MVIDRIGGYETGPDGAARAGAAAWARLDEARAVLLVEGVSDQIAVDASARVLGIDLDAAGVVVFPINGAHAIGRVLPELQATAPTARICGLFDIGEERFVRRALEASGMAPAGFFICIEDLEDELLRAAGPELVESVIAAEGDRSSFATMRAQPAWRDAELLAQARRFIGAGARRKHRYAAAFVEALGPDRLPQPILDLLANACASSGGPNRSDTLSSF